MGRGSIAATRNWPQNHRFFLAKQFSNWLYFQKSGFPVKSDYQEKKDGRGISRFHTCNCQHHRCKEKVGDQLLGDRRFSRYSNILASRHRYFKNQLVRQGGKIF